MAAFVSRTAQLLYHPGSTCDYVTNKNASAQSGRIFTGIAIVTRHGNLLICDTVCANIAAAQTFPTGVLLRLVKILGALTPAIETSSVPLKSAATVICPRHTPLEYVMRPTPMDTTYRGFQYRAPHQRIPQSCHRSVINHLHLPACASMRRHPLRPALASCMNMRVFATLEG